MKLFGKSLFSKNTKNDPCSNTLPTPIDKDTLVHLKNGIIIKEIAEKTVAVATGEAGEHFRGMITLNPTSEFILTCLMNGDKTPLQIAETLCREFDVTADTAEADTVNLINQLVKLQIVQPKGRASY